MNNQDIKYQEVKNEFVTLVCDKNDIKKKYNEEKQNQNYFFKPNSIIFLRMIKRKKKKNI
jgi:hypothetical protein